MNTHKLMAAEQTSHCTTKTAENLLRK